MSYSGFENEDKILYALNGKSFDELNINLQKLITDSFTSYHGTIEAVKQAGQNKSDLKITISNESHTYSVKKGSGNSVHQEPVEQFLLFLESNYNISENLKNDIRFFIWGDGTFNGKGNKEDRLNQNQLKKLHKDILERINHFFESIKDDLIQRFVFDGADTSTHSAEFIYFGTAKKGICCSAKNSFDLISKNKSKRAAISVGVLSFQAWNRAIKEDSVSEHRRGQIQLKLGSLEKIIKDI